MSEKVEVWFAIVREDSSVDLVEKVDDFPNEDAALMFIRDQQRQSRALKREFSLEMVRQGSILNYA